MTLLDLCHLLQDSAFGSALLESQYWWLIIESVHVLSLSLSVGMLFIADLRLIGRFRRHEPVADVLGELRPWMLSGFALMFLSGGLLFWSEAATVFISPWFKLKMMFLALAGANALLFEWRRARQPAGLGALDLPAGARMAGWTSLVCWTAVIILGRWVAYAHT
jgi:uncharacterized membrane protein SirB2